jgi:hypothetical protein
VAFHEIKILDAIINYLLAISLVFTIKIILHFRNFMIKHYKEDKESLSIMTLLKGLKLIFLYGILFFGIGSLVLTILFSIFLASF